MSHNHDHNHDHEVITLVDEQGNETLFEILLTIDVLKATFNQFLKIQMLNGI